MFTIVCWQRRERLAPQVATLNLQTKEKKILLESAGGGRYAASGPNPSVGHIVYGRNGSLFAVSFDVNRLQVGSPSPVLDGVLGIGPLSFFGFSDSGTLAYVAGGALAPFSSTLVWVDRQGAEQATSRPCAPAPTAAYGSYRQTVGGWPFRLLDRPRLQAQGDIWIHHAPAWRLAGTAHVRRA